MNDVAGTAYGVAGPDSIHIVKQDAADPVGLEHLCEAELWAIVCLRRLFRLAL